MSPVGINELKSTLEELREKYTNLSADDLFVLWFLLAYLTDQETVAEKALVGGTGDKGVDAVLSDAKAHCVFLVQAKYRQNLAMSCAPKLTPVDRINFLSRKARKRYEATVQ